MEQHGPLDELDSMTLLENQTLKELALLKKQQAAIEKGLHDTKNEIAKREQKYDLLVRGMLKRRGVEAPGKKVSVKRHPGDPNRVFIVVE